jgi:hypothetical protein
MIEDKRHDNKDKVKTEKKDIVPPMRCRNGKSNEDFESEDCRELMRRGLEKP